MAHLDVRERRVEATIAYLGPDLAGRSTNLAHLAGDPAGEGATTRHHAIELRSADLRRLDDEDVAVHIVAPRGPLQGDEVRRALDDADAIVVVLDADPTARERNARWLEGARAHLDEPPSRRRPVVVQINKLDLGDATSVEALVALTEGQPWPHVVAAALHGEGVRETLRRALDAVLDGPREGRDGARATSAGPHPLLDALRQLVTRVVDDRVVAMEERLLARWSARAERDASAQAAAIAALEERLIARMTTATQQPLEVLQEDVAASVVLTAQLRDDVAHIAAAVAQGLAARPEELAAIELTLSAAVAAGRVQDPCRKSDVEAAEKRLREELAATSRLDREHTTSTLAALRRAVEGLKVDLAPRDPTPELHAVGEGLRRLEERMSEALAALAPTTAAVRALPLKFGEAHDRTRNVVVRTVEELGARVDTAIATWGREDAEVWARLDARTAKVEASVDELIDELKKRKKGWFG